MTEDPMDDSIRRAARDLYNPPPAPPRDEMWARIRAARAAERVAPTVADARTAADDPRTTGHRVVRVAESPTGARISSAVTATSRARARWFGQALALAAMLALGIALGRLWLWHAPASPTTVAANGSPADAGNSAAPAPATRGDAGISAAAAPKGVSRGGGDVGHRTPAATGRSDGTPVEVAAGEKGTGASQGRRSPSAGANAPAAPGLYAVAARQTLGQAELVLTSYRAREGSAAAVDPQVVAWARETLSGTRLLLDSPAARDPALRSLLEDIELVLAQIVQSPAAGGGAEDAQWIDHAMSQRDLLPRLRTVVGAGASAGT